MKAENRKIEELPESYQDEICVLLETFGHFENINGVADYLGVNPRSLRFFLKSAKAKAAKAAYLPGTREATKAKIAINTGTDQVLALPDESSLKGVFELQILDLIPPAVAGAFNLLSKNKKLTLKRVKR